MKVTYDPNNSGGSWWLKDEDWKGLEKAGWFVEWGGMYFCHSEWSFHKKPDGKPEPCASEDECKGHRRFDTWQEMKDEDRYMGALARGASKDFPSLREAIQEFEKVTGQDASDEGCNCCGPPHSFNGGGEYVSGEDILPILYDNVPKNLRAACN